MLYDGWKWRFRAKYNVQVYEPKDLAGNKQILQRESLHCILMEVLRHSALPVLMLRITSKTSVTV